MKCKWFDGDMPNNPGTLNTCWTLCGDLDTCLDSVNMIKEEATKVKERREHYIRTGFNPHPRRLV